MKNYIAKFHKVSFEQFKKDLLETDGIPYNEAELQQLYDSIQLPRRATKGSAGYDFISYFPFTLGPGETIKIPTGIRVKINEDWFLGILPRSGHGFKYRIQLDNTMGVIDSDYFHAKNEGHIFIKLTNDTKHDKIMNIKAGDGFAQGIFMLYGLAEEEEVVMERTGGMGSTSKN